MRRRLPHAFLLALVLLGATELAVRCFFARNMSGRFEYGYHPTSGFQEHADGTVSLVRAGGRRFHPQTFRQSRPEGTFRIMVIGDSVARGPSLESSYPRVLGAQLRREGLNVESFNLGVAGYGGQRKLIVLRQALKYQPSLVILHVNDSNEYEDEREYKRSEEFKSWHPRNWPMKSLVIRRLYEAKTEQVFWKWLPVEIRSQQSINDADAELSASMNPEKLRQWAERVRRFTAESVRLVREAHVPILLITQAHAARDPNGRPFLDDQNLDEMIRPLVTNGVCSVSMKQVFAPLPWRTLFADGSHLRREGHEILTSAIVERLRREGLLPAPARN